MRPSVRPRVVRVAFVAALLGWSAVGSGAAAVLGGVPPRTPVVALNVAQAGKPVATNIGAGVPLAVAVKLALFPAVTDWADGCAVIDGATLAALTVSVAALLVAEPALLVATQ